MNRHVKLYLLLVAAMMLGFVLVVLLWANDDVRLDAVHGDAEVTGNPFGDVGKVSTKVRGVEPCAAEDSPWCWRVDDGRTYVNLAPADPAPVTVRLDGAAKRAGKVER